MQPPTPGYVAAAPVTYGGQRFRECKIHGKIMDPGEKDCMEYSSLVYQIESAIRQGYPDVDICAAIIRATFSKTLRAVLETRPGATLAEIGPILKAHFTVRKVRSVFLELGKVKQMKGETPFTYLMRAIALRETVTRMNREEDGELTPQLIQTQFQESLSTGFSGQLRHVMRNILRVPNVTDELLMKEVNDLVIHEAEHEEKSEDESDEVVVSANAVNVGAGNKVKKDKNPVMKEIAKIAASVQNANALQPQLEEIRKELSSQKRAFGILTGQLTPEQQTRLASEHPILRPTPFPEYDPLDYRDVRDHQQQPCPPQGTCNRGNRNRSGGSNNNNTDSSANIMNMFSGAPGANNTRNNNHINDNTNNNTNNANNSTNNNNNNNIDNNNNNGRNNTWTLRPRAPRGAAGSNRPGMCRTCAADHTIRFCPHCFRCGLQGHESQYCPVRPLN